MATQNLKHEIFEILSKGTFICSNSCDTRIQRLYSYIDEHFDELYDYYIQINLILERGDEYYYFSKAESKVELRRKLEMVFKWIDIVDFFKSYDNSFAAGFRFDPSHISVQLKVDAVLKSKLIVLKKYTKVDNELESIKKLVDMLRRDGYLELEDEVSDSYKVLSSFSYLDQLILSINIPEEIQNEIPE